MRINEITESSTVILVKVCDFRQFFLANEIADVRDDLWDKARVTSDMFPVSIEDANEEFYITNIVDNAIKMSQKLFMDGFISMMPVWFDQVFDQDHDHKHWEAPWTYSKSKDYISSDRNIKDAYDAGVAYGIKCLPEIKKYYDDRGRCTRVYRNEADHLLWIADPDVLE